MSDINDRRFISNKKLIPDRFKLKRFRDDTIDELINNPEWLKQYINQEHRAYNAMIDYVNAMYDRQEKLKEYLDELWAYYGATDGMMGQDVIAQHEFYAKRDIVKEILERSGLYDANIFNNELGPWQDNMDSCEPCDEVDK